MNLAPDEAKANSQTYLQNHSILINPALPLLESEEELSPQDSKSVARRAVVLSYIIGIGYGANVSKLKKFLEEIDLLRFASNNERKLLAASNHTDQEKVNARWHTEAVQSLAWCMGIAELDPLRPCDDDLANHFPMPYVDPFDFIDHTTLRPFEEIYQQADIHYRLHWAVRNARLTKTDCVVKEGFIRERRKPLDWVIGVEADWDEVPLDT